MQEFSAPFGKVQNLESDNDFGSSILIVEPGKEITKHYHKKTKEIEIILEGEVMCGDRIEKVGDINVWEIKIPHSYKNLSKLPVKILCITIPPYDPNDSYEVG